MRNKVYITITIASIFFLVVVIVTVGLLYLYTNPFQKNEVKLSDGKYFIAHATGSLEGYTYLNCKESLLNSLNNGYKNIEIDLQYTSDSVLVCVHDWEQFNKISIPNICGSDSDLFMRIPSVEEFKERKIYGKYTPLTLDDVISIQDSIHFTIVTDLICDASQLNKYFKDNKRKDVMVEAFSEREYSSLKQSGYIPMLSLGCITHFDCVKFIISHLFSRNIEWITVESKSSKRSLRLLKKFFNIKVALYTVNSPSFFKWYLGKDIDLIYTDNWNLKRLLNNYQDNSTL